MNGSLTIELKTYNSYLITGMCGLFIFAPISFRILDIEIIKNFPKYSISYNGTELTIVNNGTAGDTIKVIKL